MVLHGDETKSRNDNVEEHLKIFNCQSIIISF